MPDYWESALAAHDFHEGANSPETINDDDETWKATWLDFVERHHMPDSDAVSFLKEQSIPIVRLKELI